MISIKDLYFTYPGSEFELNIERLTANAGETLCIMGPSGSGKTTLINLISGILKPVRGEILVGDLNITKKNDAAIRRFRLNRMGFIFQGFELLEYLNVEQNILLPYSLDRKLKLEKDTLNRMEELLNKTGIQDKKRVYPKSLSHGEKQRVAVIRALITQPDLVIGDEPTANLDQDNANSVMDLILDLVRQKNTTFVLVTHDRSFQHRFESTFEF